MSLQSDALLAVTGLFPETISAREHAASEVVPATFAKRATRWVKTEELSEFVFVEPKKDLDKLFDVLAVPPNELDVAQWVEGLGVDDHELVADFYTSLIAARQYVVNSWPALTVDGAAGIRILPLSHDDAAEVWSIIQVLDEPERVFDELDARTLTATQALAFRECYPELYKIADEAIEAALIEKRAKDDDYDLGWEREACLNTLRGKPPEAPYTPPPPPPVTEKGLKLEPERERTQEQVSSAPKARK